MANYLFVLMIIIPGAVQCLTFTTNGSTDGNNSFECNTNVSLLCQTQNVRDFIKLEMYNTQIGKTQLANCVTRCFENTAVLGKYIVTHDFDSGFIRLDIPKITDTDASNEFTCSGDSTSLSIKPLVKVFPEKSSTKLIINEMDSTNVVEIKALTGCVLLQTNLTFVWNKTKNSNGTGLEPLSDEGFTIKNTDLSEDSNCIPSNYCGGKARSSTLTFTEETSCGVDYYITCTIVINENVSENKPRNYTVISERSFTLKESISTTKQVSDDNKILKQRIVFWTMFGVNLLFFFFFSLVIFCCLCARRVHGNYCKCLPRRKQVCFKRPNDSDCSHGFCCYKTFKLGPKSRVQAAPIGLHTEPRETSIKCTWNKEFKSNTVVQLSYTNTETDEKCDRELTADEKQNRSCTINNLQPSTKYSLVMKASDSRNRTEEKSDNIEFQTLD